MAAAHKPHTGSVRSVRITAVEGGANRGAVATVGGDGNVFFFVLDLTAASGQQLTPTRYVFKMSMRLDVLEHLLIQLCL